MTQPLLSILCVTKAEPYAEKFVRDMAHLAQACHAEFVLMADGEAAGARAYAWQGDYKFRLGVVHSQGYIESVLDEAVDHTAGEYVLRLDDDERVTPEMASWLRHASYTTANHWSFPRMWLYQSTEYVLRTSLLWPDPQTRLSVRKMAGTRYKIHEASPFGIGVMASVAIEHHKLLVKNLYERREIAANYERLSPGSGTGLFLAFYCPEDYYGSLPIYPREAVAAA